MAKLTDLFFHQIWLIVIYSYLLFSTIRHYISLTYKTILAKYNPNNNPVNFVNLIKNLPKVPSHIALSFQYDRKNELLITNQGNNNDNEDEDYLHKPVLDLKQVAKVTAWTIGAGINTVTLYDIQGALKDNFTALKHEVDEAVRVFLAEIKSSEKRKEPQLVWHKVLPGNRCTSLNKYDAEIKSVRNEVNIFICSYEDGKPKLIQMVKDMHQDRFQNNKLNSLSKIPKENIKNSNQTIDVNTVNEYLRRPCCEAIKTADYKIEPDLLLNFGTTQSTMEFLPWHIRLTELDWLPQVKYVQLYEVLTSFYKYAKCEQRFGK